MKFLGWLIWKIKIINRLALEKYQTSKVKAGKGSSVRGLVEIEHPENILIGINSFVNGGQLFAGNDSKIIIGNNCMISYNVHIRTTYHNFTDTNIPMNAQGMSERDIVIEDNCWIGHSAHIMPGVTIHEGGGGRCQFCSYT